MIPLKPQERLKINGKSIIVDEYIHSGYCTQVYRAKNESLGIPVIIKRFTESGPIQKSAYDASNIYWKEVRDKLRALLAPDILYCDNKFQLTEYIPGKNLEDCCEALEGIAVPYVKRIIEDILRQIEILVEHGLTHEDIKPSNLVLLPGNDQSRIATLIDFDCMRPLKKNNHRISLGTPWFMSPEQEKGEYPKTNDAYSLAMTAIDLLHGGKRLNYYRLRLDMEYRQSPIWPFPNTKEEIRRQLLKIFPEHARSIHGLLNFIFACLQSNHLKRPQSTKEMSQMLWDTGNITEI